MKFLFAAGALFAAAASAQSIADLPACSVNCIAEAVLKSCTAVTDYACACKAADKVAAAAQPCIVSACTSTADQAKVATTLNGICAAQGLGAKSSSAAPVSSAPATSAAPASTTKAPTAGPSAQAHSSTTSCSTSTTYTTITLKPTGIKPTVNSASNGTVVTATPTQFTGAAAANGVTFGVAGVLGLLAYLI